MFPAAGFRVGRGEGHHAGDGEEDEQVFREILHGIVLVWLNFALTHQGLRAGGVWFFWTAWGGRIFTIRIDFFGEPTLAENALLWYQFSP